MFLDVAGQKRAAARERLRKLRRARKDAGLVQFVVYIPDTVGARQAVRRFAGQLCAETLAADPAPKPATPTTRQLPLFPDGEGD
ncbi:MAG: hypothetical protein HQL41_14475 [Alphaproteobacteria bacterium]|nr:hypothetical protein [Alphaproteobacteria bacterium]